MCESVHPIYPTDILGRGSLQIAVAWMALFPAFGSSTVLNTQQRLSSLSLACPKFFCCKSGLNVDSGTGEPQHFEFTAQCSTGVGSRPVPVVTLPLFKFSRNFQMLVVDPVRGSLRH